MKIKKNFKVVLALAMTLAMLVACIPMTVSAADDVCKIGDKTYASVYDAINDADDGAVIDVFANTRETRTITIDKKIELTSSNGSAIQIASDYSKLFRIGTGFLESDTPGELILSGNLVINSKTIDTVLICYGTFTMKDEVHCKTNKGFFLSTEIPDKTKNPAHINILGGTMESTAEKADQATIFFGGRKSTLNISGGALLQKLDGAYAIKMCGENSKINITDGLVSAVSNPLAVYGAFAGKEINISGGIVEATESGIFKTYSKCDYLTINISDNALLRAKKNTVSLTSPMSSINISGGTIIATEDTTINMGYGALNISGGKFILEGTTKKGMLLKSAFDSSNPLPSFITITGGVFINKNPNNTYVMNDSTKGTEPIDLQGATVLYHDSVDSIIRGKIDAPKTTTAKYDGETYYVYTKTANTDEKYAAVMNEGATLRLVEGSSGLRFGAEFSSKVVKKIGSSDNTSYGMLIVPSQYLVNLGGFTVEKLTEKYGESGFLNIVCTEDAGLIKNEDGSISLQAAIVNIKEDNYDMSFSAVAYVCIDGAYYYSAFDQAANSATVKNLSNNALKNENANYTPAELTIINGFAGN